MKILLELKFILKSIITFFNLQNFIFENELNGICIFVKMPLLFLGDCFLQAVFENLFF